MNIRQKLVQYAVNRRAVRELSRLSDHTLSDLGISRSEINSAVFGR